MGVRVNGPILNYRVSNQYLSEEEGSVRNYTRVLNKLASSVRNSYMVPKKLHQGTEQAP